MLHPSYTDLMAVVNSDVEQGEEPIVRSRYSIVLATAKRARQIIAGQQPLVKTKGQGIKPLSIAVEELHNGKIRVLTEEEAQKFKPVAEKLNEMGIFMTGLDVIDGKIIEINVTSPCYFIKEINHHFGIELEKQITAYILSKVKSAVPAV